MICISQEKKISEIMKLTGLSRASVHSYLPYTKGIYNAAEISLNVERCRIYKIRQEQVRFLKKIPLEENLWQADPEYFLMMTDCF